MDMTKDEWFAITIKSLRDLADQIEKREIRPVNLERNRAYKRIMNKRSELVDFRPGNFRLILEYEMTIPPEVFDGRG